MRGVDSRVRAIRPGEPGVEPDLAKVIVDGVAGDLDEEGVVGVHAVESEHCSVKVKN